MLQGKQLVVAFDYSSSNSAEQDGLVVDEMMRLAPPLSYHRRAPRKAELQQVFRLQTERRIGNDWVVRYEGRFLQLKPQQRHRGPTQAKAMVCE